MLFRTAAGKLHSSTRSWAFVFSSACLTVHDWEILITMDSAESRRWFWCNNAHVGSSCSGLDHGKGELSSCLRFPWRCRQKSWPSLHKVVHLLECGVIAPDFPTWNRRLKCRVVLSPTVAGKLHSSTRKWAFVTNCSTDRSSCFGHLSWYRDRTLLL